MPELVQASVSLLVLAGASLYAAIRFGQQVFYNQFDVRPSW